MDALFQMGSDVPTLGMVSPPLTEGAFAMRMTTVGIDLAKTVFQIHGEDDHEKPVFRKKLVRWLNVREVATWLKIGKTALYDALRGTGQESR